MPQTYEGLQLRVFELSKIRRACQGFTDNTADMDISDMIRELEDKVNEKIQTAEKEMERFF